jgi:putative phage-type endonuclease
MDRTRGIGGSDQAAICGLSPWKTPLQVYLEKTGEAAPTPDNPAMAYGRMLEPVIRDWYTSETGVPVIVPDEIAHPKYGFLLANLDGLTGEKVIEIKTARSDNDWGEPGTDHIPLYYMTQVQYYMLLVNLPLADIPVSFYGQMPVIYTVEADPEIQEMLLEKSIKFWELVQRRTPPDPVNMADMVAMFGKRSVAAEVVAPAGIQNVVRHYKEAQNQIKSLEKSIEAYKFEICNVLGEKDTLIGLDGKPMATWKKAKDGKKFDDKAFAQDHPDLFEQYLRDREGSRRFLVK